MLIACLLATAVIYWSGLHGGWLFDDYPNIVDNHGVQPGSGDIRSLISAALSSPASDFKRPLASLSFAANYLVGGLDPFGMKLTNLVIHLLNGVLVYLLALTFVQCARSGNAGKRADHWLPLLVSAGWLLLPINLTSVLYVVQRMESMANVFVLVGLLGYVQLRRRMLQGVAGWRLPVGCAVSLTVPTAIGVLAKETAIMLPLYALLIEWLLFGFRRTREGPRDRRVVALFLLVLVLPLAVGLVWLVPRLLRPESWATRDFTMGTRVLTEMRVVMDYAGWTLLPLPHSLSFYHDDYVVSTGLFRPWTTVLSLAGLGTLAAFALWMRKRNVLVSLGIALFLGCQLLTATILPLELVYEHRNYFASFGLLLAVFSLLFPLAQRGGLNRALVLACTGALLLWWTGLTAATAHAWGEPLRLARELAERAPASPRAQYELGRTYIIYSRNDPDSPYTRLAYAPLERAAALPQSSILPQQALIFMNSHMKLPLKNVWWESMGEKLRLRRPGVQDESSLAALAQCAERAECDLPQARVQGAFEAAMSHPDPSPRLLSTYASYVWNVMGERSQAVALQTRAADSAPGEAAYQITLIRMLLAQSEVAQAQARLIRLQQLNLGGHLDSQIDTLRQQLSQHKSDDRQP
ncbi:hypothetical protein P5Y53_05770 [Dyella jiangningensis]|uniref:hypothetical protein n=1 Tax=Dyella jiangningensis TaxID=1379159 RepID=UPI00240FB62F|nr:hypothetical protein [Dyella jiangningensis]MDG2537167.1 hypothetical protein [Dyella jiangningensis]